MRWNSPYATEHLVGSDQWGVHGVSFDDALRDCCYNHWGEEAVRILEEMERWSLSANTIVLTRLALMCEQTQQWGSLAFVQMRLRQKGYGLPCVSGPSKGGETGRAEGDERSATKLPFGTDGCQSGDCNDVAPKEGVLASAGQDALECGADSLAQDQAHCSEFVGMAGCQSGACKDVTRREDTLVSAGHDAPEQSADSPAEDQVPCLGLAGVGLEHGQVDPAACQ